MVENMAKSSNQKLKLMYLKDILMEKTDEKHSIRMKEIIEELYKRDVKAERKSIYHDIEELKRYGMDIEYRKEAPEGYYLASRPFELPELKLLVDAVQASKFITEKKSRSLIKKLENLSSVHEALCLRRQTYVSDRVKNMNESIYYNVDKIHSAISEGVQITFQYAEWTMDKELRPKKGGTLYSVSPWRLIWENENYYLVAFDQVADIMKHFRVDKMVKISITKKARCGLQLFREIDMGGYINKTFGMFGGTEEILKIRFPEAYLGIVIDRFGKEVSIRPETKGCFIVRVRVVVSEQFFGWLTGLGKNVIILSPDYVAEGYKQTLEGILENVNQR